jgi:hypothetical protein
MNDRPFLDISNKPTEPAIKAALGSTYPCYKDVIGLAGSFSRDWTFTKSSGWMLKIFDAKKSLLYVIPLAGGFKLSMAIRETEREVFLQDDELVDLRGIITSSKKFTEGFAIKFDIDGTNDFRPVELFIKKLITLRS